MIRRHSKMLLAAGVAALLALAAQPVAAGVVGQVISESAVVDGVSVPSGSTLLTDSLVVTRDEPVAIRLSSGRVLGVGENSSARFDEAARGGVAVAVVAGTVGYEDGDGGAVLLAQGTSALLDQEDEEEPAPAENQGQNLGESLGETLGHVWEGEPVDPDEEIALCHLKDRKHTRDNIILCAKDPDDLDPDERDQWKKVCDWTRIKVEWEIVPMHLAHSDVFADEDMRTATMPDEIDCGKKGALWALAALLLIPVIEGENDDGLAEPFALSPIVPAGGS